MFNLLKEVVKLEASTISLGLLHFGLMVLFYSTVLFVAMPLVCPVTFTFLQYVAGVSVLGILASILHGKV